MTNINAVRAAHSKVRDAEKDLRQVIERELPVGTEIRWMLGGNVQRGVVLDHDRGRRLFVRNYRSAKKYWLDIYHTLSYEANP